MEQSQGSLDLPAKLAWVHMADMLKTEDMELEDHLDDLRDELSGAFVSVLQKSASFHRGIVARYQVLNEKNPIRDAKDWCGRCVGDLLFPLDGAMKLDVRCRNGPDDAEGTRACLRCHIDGVAPASSEEWALSPSMSKECEALVDAVMRFPFHPRSPDGQRNWIDYTRARLMERFCKLFVGEFIPGTMEIEPCTAVPPLCYMPGEANGDYVLATLARRFFLQTSPPRPFDVFPLGSHREDAMASSLKESLMEWRQGCADRRVEWQLWGDRWADQAARQGESRESRGDSKVEELRAELERRREMYLMGAGDDLGGFSELDWTEGVESGDLGRLSRLGGGI